MPLSDPALYEYSPIVDRPKLSWPDDARVALWVAPNIEFYEFQPVPNPTRKPWPRTQPDILHYSHRDYGNRVGLWRMMEVMDRYGVRGSISLNVAICDHHGEIVEACLERKWEFFSHGIYNTRYTYGMDEAQERAMIEDAIGTVQKHTGQRLAGWLSPALTNTERTQDLLAEYGIKYSCDFFHDDQPFPLTVKQGRLISIPYSLETNDVIVYNTHLASPRDYGRLLQAQFDQLYAEGAESGRVMCIPLHPFMIGQPHRLRPFAEALEYITTHDKVWVTTGAEIADWYYTHHYDGVVSHLAVRSPRR